MIESVLPVLIQDNLDLACQAVEKAAMDRAVSDVDDGFAHSFELRRRHREVSRLSSYVKSNHSMFLQQRPGQAFWDPSVPHIPFANSLPDPLRLKPSGVQPQQAVVYEDFSTSDCLCSSSQILNVS